MRHLANSTLRLFFVCFTMGLISCGGAKGKSAAVGVRILPERPIVFTGDSVGFNNSKITAPWFGFGVTISNPTDEYITIIGVQAEVTSIDNNGDLITSTSTWSPAEWNHSPSDTVTCSYSNFGVISPGAEDIPLQVATGDAACAHYASFAVGNVPSGPSKNNFIFRVKLKPLGWFGTILNPSGRLEKFKYFSTQ